MSKETSDFRYNTGASTVPWAAVGENYNAEDTYEFVKFLMGGKGKEYNAALKEVKAALAKLAKVSVAPGKLSMGDKVSEVERMVDKYLGAEEGSSLFVSNCTAALRWATAMRGSIWGRGDRPGEHLHCNGRLSAFCGAKLVFADVAQDTVNFTLQMSRGRSRRKPRSSSRCTSAVTFATWTRS